MLGTESPFSVKQKLLSELAEKTQHLFLKMGVPVKLMIKCNEKEK